MQRVARASRARSTGLAARGGVWLVPPMDKSAGELRARRRGRRAAMAVYCVIVAAFTLLAAGSVTWQVLTPTFAHFAPVDCRTGLFELARSVERARAEAGRSSEGGEEATVSRFRAALGPEWDRHPAIAASC